jgi:sugar-specific transcriptional regulator TrmB
METDPVDEPRSAAIEQLERFGLSTYAARTFVALVMLGTGTAKDVSRVSEVPRTRVYDAIEELQGFGLVDVQQASPKEFWAISAETTVGTFEREMDERLSILVRALDELEPVERPEEQRGVWTVDSQSSVTDRVIEFIGEADEEVVYMTVEDLLTDDVVEALRGAAERDATIHLGGVSSEVQERIQDDIPDAEMFESLWVWSDTPAGRLMMVDDRRTLVSVLVNGVDDAPTEPRAETAIWGAGETNSLVVVLRAIFTHRLGGEDPLDEQ